MSSRGLFSSVSFRGSRKTSSLPRVVRHWAERLEQRFLLSTINWANRGTTDNFAAYGTNADVARSIVDRAIGDWENVISNFNYTGGGNTYTLNIKEGALDPNGGRGLTDPATRNNSTQKKPISTTITLDDNGGGNGWYFDPSIGNATFPDDVEFDSLLTPFTADATGKTGNDFYRTIVHEIGHAMGISDDSSGYLKISDYLTDAGADPNGGTIRALNFNGGAIDYTLTSNGGGHMWEGASGTTYTGPAFPNDLMNDGRTISLGLTRRELITDSDAFLLRDVYGYTINTPSTLNNMYVAHNFQTNQVVVRGLQGANSDTEVVDSSTIFGGFTFISFSVNGYTKSYIDSSVSSISLSGGDGTDYLRLESTDGKAVTVNGGAGNDFFDFGFTRQNLGLITGNTYVTGGSGSDQIFAYDNQTTAAQTYTITSARFDRPGWGGFSYASDIEFENLFTGTAADTVNVTSTYTNQPVFLFSAGGGDTVNVGNSSNGVQSIASDVQINNTPSFTTVNINNGPDTVGHNVQAFTSGVFGVIFGLAPANIVYKYSDTQAVNVAMGSGNDSTIISATTKPLNFSNANGSQRDSYFIGSSAGTDNILGAIRIAAAGFAANDIVVDNLGGAARSAATLINSAANEYRLSGFTGGGSITYTRTGFNSGEAFTIRGGNNAESLTVTNVADTGSLSFDGRGGTDSFSLDDRLLSTVPNTDSFTVDTITRTGASNGATYAFQYFNIESLGFSTANTVTTLNVYGVPSTIAAGYQVTIVLPNANNIANVYPHDSSGNKTINGSLGIIGGSGFDEMRIQDTASNLPLDYSFSNPFGSGTQDLFGLGTGGLGTAAIELWTLNASSGADTFAINQFTSGVGLAIKGGGGNDTVNFGNNGVAAITNMASFSFDGGANSDTLNFNNQTQTSPWTYTVNPSTLTAQSSVGATYVLTDIAVESLRVNGGANAETANVNSVPSSQVFTFNGAAGFDTLRVGVSTNNLDTINGPIIFDAGTNGGVVIVSDTADTTADTLHLTATSLGATNFDTLFGVGGALYFSNLGDPSNGPVMTIALGSGSDTAYVAPLAAGKVAIDGGSPTAAPGDQITFALAGVTSPVLAPSGTSGTLTSTNRGTVSYSSFETAPVLDSVAPFITSVNYVYNAAVPTLTIQFNEDVGSFPLSELTLTNTTTGATIPSILLNSIYIASAHTASITFTGFAHGVPTDGNYSVSIDPLYSDAAGNVGTTTTVSSFFQLAGDLNHDRHVNFDDLVILAQNYNKTGKSFAEGNVDYSADGNVNFDDLVILAQNYNKTLAAPGGIASSLVASTPAKAPAKTKPTALLAELA